MIGILVDGKSRGNRDKSLGLQPVTCSSSVVLEW